MSTKFFNNTDGNSLFDKFKGIAHSMADFHTFQAVVGYFRSSGYFKLRDEFSNAKKIQLLVGINVDNLFKKQSKLILGKLDEVTVRKAYSEDFIEEVKNAGYDKLTEQGILQFCQDICEGKLEIRIHQSKNLHAKFYLLLPEEHNKNSDSWVIMGSSNLSDQGLGISTTERYELNVAMKDYDDVAFCKNEFEALWQESVPLTLDDIDAFKKKTYLGYQPTPYELFIKVLIDAFGNQVMSRLDDLNKAMETLRKEGLPVNDLLEQKANELEEEIIKKEILPVLTKTIEPALKPVQRELVLVVDYVPGQPLSVHLSRKRNFTAELDDAKEIVLDPEVSHTNHEQPHSDDKIQRGPTRDLSFIFPDGTEIAENTAVETLVKVVKKIGVAEVRKVVEDYNLKFCKVPVISNRRDAKYGKSQKELGGG